LTAGTAEDPRKTTTYRVMVVVVSILGVLLVVAMITLIVGVAVKVTGRHNGAGPVFAPSSLSTQLPAGAKITSIETSGNRVVIGLHTPQGDEVDIFDTETGRPVARIRAAGTVPK
jgi:hypothetical protein